MVLKVVGESYFPKINTVFMEGLNYGLVVKVTY